MKTILVTGGNRGIGLEICRQLYELGHTVILCSRDLNKGKKAADSIGKNVIAMQLDVTDENSIQNLAESVNTDFGNLDVLINNAGLGATHTIHENTIIADAKSILHSTFHGIWYKLKKLKPLAYKVGILNSGHNVTNVSLMYVRYIMETNFYGAWQMIQAFTPLLLKSKEGRIINISSGMGEIYNLSGDYPAYRLSKSSLNALTIMLSKELKASGISVNAVCPGWVKTDMGGSDAPLHVSEGADTAVWIATEKNFSTGNFYRNREIVKW